MERTVLTVAIMFVFSLSSYASNEIQDRLANFGEIVAVGKVDIALCNCPCMSIVELLDTSENSLVLCVGLDPDNPHLGLKIITGSFYSEETIPVQFGSDFELDLIKRISKYLDKKYTSEDKIKWKNKYGNSDLSENELKDYKLQKLLQNRDRGYETLRWLKANFTSEEQERVFSKPCEESWTEPEKKAFRLICHTRGGSCIESKCLECVF